MESGNKKGLPLWSIIAISVLAVAIVVLGVLWAVDYFGDDELPFRSFTASDAELVQNADRVIAKVGDRELTNAQLQVYYWIYVYSFMEENSYYLSMMGFDYTKDLGTQECYLKKGISWQEYFVEQALAAWHQYTILNLKAEEEDYKLPEEEQKYLDELKETMDKVAKENQLENAEELIKKEMGAGATWEAYAQYSKETFVGMGYYQQFADDLKLTQEDFEKHYTDNLQEYKDNNIALKDQAYCVSVRHILITPVTKDEEGNTIDTETAWENCRQKAQQILDGYLAGGKIDEDAFATLATTLTEDTSSKTNGGLYTDFVRGKMVAEFEDWSFDATRKYGDTGLVKTTYGYHIMFFVNGSEICSASVRHIMLCPEVTKDADGKDVITDAAWADCKAKAEKLLKEYRKIGKIDEEAFVELVKKHTEDDETKADGGLCAQFMRGQIGDGFDTWSFDAARKYGDTGLVKTASGYHVVFFVSTDAEWQRYAEYALSLDACNDLLSSLKVRYPIEADYNKILIGHLVLG